MKVEESISDEELKRTLNDIISRRVTKTSKLKSQEKRILLSRLHDRDGEITKNGPRYYCHYCGIEEKEFPKIWTKPIYKRGTRKRFEIEHTDSDYQNLKQFWDLNNLALACPICNIAKSDQFSEKEFKRIGKIIKKIWQKKALVKLKGEYQEVESEEAVPKKTPRNESE